MLCYIMVSILILYGVFVCVYESDGFANPMAVDKSMNYIQMGWVR